MQILGLCLLLFLKRKLLESRIDAYQKEARAVRAQLSQTQTSVFTQQVDSEKRVNAERQTMIKTLEDQQVSLVTQISDMKQHVCYYVHLCALLKGDSSLLNYSSRI